MDQGSQGAVVSRAEGEARPLTPGLGTFPSYCDTSSSSLGALFCHLALLFMKEYLSNMCFPLWLFKCRGRIKMLLVITYLQRMLQEGSLVTGGEGESQPAPSSK